MFGSVAREFDRADSDVDVAVHFEPGMDAGERFKRALRLGVELERALDREVDVIDLQEAPLRLAGRILTERVVILGHERPERVRYETELFRREAQVGCICPWQAGVDAPDPAAAPSRDRHGTTRSTGTGATDEPVSGPRPAGRPRR